MDRRSFIGRGIPAFAALLHSAETVPSQAGGLAPPRDERYVVLSDPIRWVPQEAIPKVIEVFWYGCPHCYAFEQELRKPRPEALMWQRQVHRMPAMFEVARVHAAAFFAAQQLNIMERFHWAFFQAIHEQRRLLNTDDEIVGFIETLGVARSLVASTLASAAVARKLEWAMEFSGQARATFVPWIVVNGKFTCSPKSAGGNEALLKLIDELLTI